MYERSLNEVKSILAARKIPLVSVREIWEEVVKRSKIEGFEVASLGDFSAMLEGDQRFQIIPAQVKNEDDKEDNADGDFAEDDMENLGFFSEDQVRLRIVQTARAEVTEDEEEVGSIRRKAFVSREAKTGDNKPAESAKKTPKKKSKKSVKKNKKRKPVRNTGSKKKKRSRK